MIDLIFLDPQTRSIIPFDSAALLTAAYERAAEMSRAPGAPPPPPTPAFTGDPRTDKELFRAAYLALLAGVNPSTDRAALAHVTLHALADRANGPDRPAECALRYVDPARVVMEQIRGIGTLVISSIGTETVIDTQFQPFDHDFVIREVAPGTPADRAGLKPGDRVLAVDGMSVFGAAFATVVDRVRGTPGTSMTITLQRPNDEVPRDVLVARALLTISPLAGRVLESAGGRRVGYIRLYGLPYPITPELQRVLADFGARGVTGLIIDVRQYVAGNGSALREFTGKFVNGDVLGYVLQRSGEREPGVTLPSDYLTRQYPLALLAGPGTRWEGEEFMAALQDYGVGRVFGQQTAGCVTALDAGTPLPDGSRLDVMTAIILTPQGRNLLGVGLTPDEAVAPDPSWQTDPVLDAAMAWLATQP